MKTKIFCDSADLTNIKKFNNNSLVSGFTTNPSLMKLSGAKNYRNYSLKLLKICKKKPISLEVFGDTFDQMLRQAMIISSWGKNVYVKIPITNTKGKSTARLLAYLTNIGVKCNVTAIFTINQIRPILKIINRETPIIFSIFAGRIADAGYNPISIVNKAVKLSKKNKNVSILWASPREIYNLFDAEKSKCHIITVGYDILEKIELIGNNLENFSLSTVNMFYKDAKKSGFKI